MGQVDTIGGKRRRKRWPEALKREIVAATLKPGASVSVVARRYDVNANQVFMWRRRYRDACEPLPTPSRPTLVPVTITSEPEDDQAAPSSPPMPATPETIEIVVSGEYRIRVGSGFDVRTLKRVLDVLRRR